MKSLSYRQKWVLVDMYTTPLHPHVGEVGFSGRRSDRVRPLASLLVVPPSSRCNFTSVEHAGMDV